jgi:CHAT domain-containing protein
MRSLRIPLLAASLTLALQICQPAPTAREEATKAHTDTGASTTAPNFLPPPRTVADILSLVRDIKPDPSYVAKLRKRANAEPPADLNGSSLAAFLFDRGVARSDLGDDERAVRDLREVVRLGGGAQAMLSYIAELIGEENSLGNHRAALADAEQRRALQPKAWGPYLALASTLLSLGDIQGAESAAAQAADLVTSPSPTARYLYSPVNGPDNAAMSLASLRGRLALIHGRYAEAEGQFRSAVAMASFIMQIYGEVTPIDQSAQSYQSSANRNRGRIATALALQRRYAEAEAVGRESLVDDLRRFGPESADTARDIRTLASIISLGGRHREAAQLAKAALDIYSGLGLLPADGIVLVARSELGVYQTRAGQLEEATASFAELKSDLLARDDANEYDRILGSNSDFAFVESSTGHPQDAIKIDQRCIDKLTTQLGPDHFQTAICRAYLGAALADAGRRQEALAAFKAALPILIGGSDDDPLSNNDRIIREIVSRYLHLLDEIRGTSLESSVGNAAAEGFRFADALRSQAVRQALAEATTRMSLPDPALAELARREQDIGNQRRELNRLLLAVVSAPPDQRDEGAVARLRSDVSGLDAARTELRQEIAGRFPRYAGLLSPQAGAGVDEVQRVLRDDEALIAIESLDDRTLVWAVAKHGPLVYASMPMKRSDLAFAVAFLRHALDPHAKSLGDIPPFDVEVAHKLYAALLEPVAAGWRSHKNLIVVTDGPLEQIPLSLLVTRSVLQPTERSDQALFSGYENVPFLVREAAITQIPSVSSMISLRKLPQGPAERRPFVGFGDPWFNAQEAAEAKREQMAPLIQVANRSGTVALRAGPDTERSDTARLSQLPRLPDTAEEVREIAAALRADSARDVYLGAQASEETVETVKLDDRRIVMFATHGLAPGDLDGLTQPALALSAPAIVGGRGDGLLTAEKILSLKLDADWVVLSACNTAAGDGAGAEAVSGLGRAFFYAGARALLVTKWPVETISARLLTTSTFRHQAIDANLTRAGALRQAEVDLIDGPGSVNAEGRKVFSYAHPIFWAPFSLVGDGG